MALNGNTDETNGYNSVIKNGVTTNANLIKSVICPIGTVMSWLKTLTNCPALPDGWVECNGQVLSDADSPFDGVTIPDLNGGTYRMLRGSSTSGTTGGADTHSHNVTQSDSGYFDNLGGMAKKLTATSVSNLPAYYEVVFIIRIK